MGMPGSGNVFGASRLKDQLGNQLPTVPSSPTIPPIAGGSIPPQLPITPQLPPIPDSELAKQAGGSSQGPTLVSDVIKEGAPVPKIDPISGMPLKQPGPVQETKLPIDAAKYQKPDYMPFLQDLLKGLIPTQPLAPAPAPAPVASAPVEKAAPKEEAPQPPNPKGTLVPTLPQAPRRQASVGGMRRAPSPSPEQKTRKISMF